MEPVKPIDVRRIFDNPWVFEISQRLIPFTVRVYEELARKHANFDAGDRILDIGCGVGWHRRLFQPQDYTGIDINPAYVERATRMYGRRFHVMDASRLRFPDGSFDGAICIATLHHLNDDLVRLVITEGLRVVKPGGPLHLIDPVLPVDPGSRLKRFVFENDRGRFQRTLSQMTRLVGDGRTVARADFCRGTLHDVAYFRLDRNASSD